MKVTKSKLIPIIIILLHPYISSYCQPKSGVGDIAPNAIRLDADNLSSFHNGAAVITKGGTTALINAKGQYIYQYGDFDFTEHYSEMNNVLWEVASSKMQHGALMDAKGKIVYQPPLRADYKIIGSNYYISGLTQIYERRFSSEGYTSVRQIFITNNGETFWFKNLYVSDFNEGLGIYQDVKTKKFGYARNDSIIIPAVYEDAQVFHEGLAAVSIINRYNEKEWGFINKNGKMIISAIFVIQPGNFYNGLAQITVIKGYPDYQDYSEAFINKKGDTVLHVPKELHLSYPNQAYFDNNNDAVYVRRPDCFYFKNGSIISKKRLLDSLNLPQSCEFDGLRMVSNQLLYSFQNPDKTSLFAPPSYAGLIFLGKQTYFPPVFYRLTIFDSVSNLAWAKKFIGRDENDQEKYVEGYINKEGKFIMYIYTSAR